MSGKRMRTPVRLGILALVASMFGGHAIHAEEDEPQSPRSAIEIDTEHIFGFTEGTDIGETGEREIESTTVTTFGKIGRYANVSNETSFRYVLTDRLRLSFGALTDFYSIHDVPDLANRSQFGLSGFDAEARFVVVDHRSAPFGMDIGITPQWRWFDETAGQRIRDYAVPIVVAIDKEIIPNTLYAAANLTFTPSLSRLNGVWLHEDATEASFAISGAVAPNILLGGEVRHLSFADNGSFKAQAVFAGPSVYARLSPHVEAKIAWSAQVSNLSKNSLDLDNFARHQIELLFSYTF